MNRKELRKKVYDKYRGHCAYCGKEIAIEDMQMDHIKPRWHNVTRNELDGLGIEKGTDDIENLYPSCRRCNFRKGTMDIEQFRKEIGLQCKRIMNLSFQVKQSIDYGLLEYHNRPIVFYFEKDAK
jgi:5-methylcytosine-specific restriction endonuclease McrA